MDLQQLLDVSTLIVLSVFVGIAIGFALLVRAASRADDAKSSRCEYQAPLEIKDVLAVPADAVEEFIRGNRLFVSLDHCRKLIGGMPDHDIQEFRLFTMLGRAVLARPKAGYVVRMGRR